MTRTIISGVLAMLLATSATLPATAQGNSGDKGRSEAASDKGGDKGDRDRGNSGRDRAERDDDDDDGDGETHGNRGRDRDDHPGQGEIRSQLKNLNAANASETALQNADPDSNVGRIAGYRDAVLASEDSYPEYQEDYQTLTTLGLQDYATATDEEIAGYVETLEPDSEESVALTDYAESRESYSEALGAESTALMELTGERELSEEALREFRSQLGLE